MSQHDYVIDNQDGASFRSDINQALAAIVSNNSGPSEPATPYPYLLWQDTTAGVLKQRNAANTAWITLLNAIGAASEANLNAAQTAKARVNFNGTGTVAIREAFNVTSITDNGVGIYTLNFATAMPTANYSVAGVCQFDSTNGRSPRVIHAMIYNTASLRINTVSTSSSEDLPYINVVIFG